MKNNRRIVNDVATFCMKGNPFCFLSEAESRKSFETGTFLSVKCSTRVFERDRIV